MSLNVAIVGPGRSNQGTGPYIARTFSTHGINICGVVSSSLNSAKNATQQLHADFEIDCEPYENLKELLKSKTVDIVAISSPASSHLDYVKLAVSHNCHIFCEKPLWWYNSDTDESISVERATNETTKLVKQCNDKNLVLQLNTQWPFTLPTYYELYPSKESKTNNVKIFSMWLYPQSTSSNMVIDAVPHVLSMLYSILSAGRIQNIEADVSNQNLTITFNYMHAVGDTEVSIHLQSSDEVPKPAAYSINGNRVDRHVELSNYLISLRSSDRQLAVMDPLECSVKNFISSIYSKAGNDETALIDGMYHLAEIYQVVVQKISNS